MLTDRIGKPRLSMRKTATTIAFVLILGLSQPASAQLRDQFVPREVPVRVYGTSMPSFSLSSLFSPNVFQMSHSVEFSSSSFGGAASSLGMYTTSMQWQFSDKLAARADVAVATDFGANQAFGNPYAAQGPQVFIRNAEVAYRPNDRTRIHFSYRQAPRGSMYGMMNPYGAIGPYGYNPGYYGYAPASSLFWKDDLR